MFNKPFQDITLADLNDLIRLGVVESNNLEFKKEIWARDDEGIREMLRDISSMANAYGGYFVIGMDEDETGKAKQLVQIPDIEEERDRILGSTISNLQPRVIGLDMRTIEFDTNKKVLLIRIPQSLNIHQITFKGLYQFWKRHDRQKTKMTYEEIREAIIKNSSSSIEVEDLLAQRKEIIKAGNPVMMMVALPLKLETELFKIGNADLRAVLQDHGPERANGWTLNFRSQSPRPTLNGLKIGQLNRYELELYRNGYIEVVVNVSRDNLYREQELHLNGVFSNRNVFYNTAIVELIYSFIKKVKAVLNIIGFDSPYAFSVNFFHIRNLVLPSEHHSSQSYSGRNYASWGEENLEIPLLSYETVDPKIITKEICDRIWQAFGFEHEPYFRDGDFNF